MYMLDTNICIYVLKSHPDKLRHKFKTIKNICISSVTYSELCFGVENGDSSLIKTRCKQLKLFTQNLLIDPYDENAAIHYGFLRKLLKTQGTTITNHDLLIAAHARSIKAVLVTNQIREFNRVPDLSVENWLSSAPA